MCCVSWTRQIRKTQKSIRSWPHPSHGFLKHTDTRNDVCDEQQRCFPIAEVEWHCSSSFPAKQGAAQAIEICSSRIPSVYALPTMGRLQVLFLGKLICWKLNRFISKRNQICSLLGVFTPQSGALQLPDYQPKKTSVSRLQLLDPQPGKAGQVREISHWQQTAAFLHPS